MDQFDPTEDLKPRGLDLHNLAVWPIIILAAVFVGYLCFDAWRNFRQKKRIIKMREEAKRTHEQSG